MIIHALSENKYKKHKEIIVYKNSLQIVSYNENLLS